VNKTSQRWRQIAPSEFPWEREALAFVRQGLPDYEPYRAWSNLEFIAEDGSIHEVDLLVLGPKGFFLVEIKSWTGTLEGDSTTWVLHRDGKVHTHDSPLDRTRAAGAGLHDFRADSFWYDNAAIQRR
jgi:hypothetical protein